VVSVMDVAEGGGGGGGGDEGGESLARFGVVEGGDEVIDLFLPFILEETSGFFSSLLPTAVGEGRVKEERVDGEGEGSVGE
jgi:hypothetical protein